MNKAELVLAVQKQLGSDTSRTDAERSLNAVLSSLERGLKKDKQVQIVGFGAFNVKARPARTGRNPQTGAEIRIKASRTVTFRAGKELKSSL
ncbi:MAG: HU family DNA-binding protein [Planctomycetes bacterium]|nr:HU family DNA-binding protein [Planctomycetota bacterium]MBI3844440.1 HU family DNA-binding protein [Planctomycetota bacterium]